MTKKAARTTKALLFALVELPLDQNPLSEVKTPTTALGTWSERKLSSLVISQGKLLTLESHWIHNRSRFELSYAYVQS